MSKSKSLKHTRATKQARKVATPAPARKHRSKAGLVVQKGHPHTKVSGKGVDQATGKAIGETTTHGPSVKASMVAAFNEWKDGIQLSVLAAKFNAKRSALRRAFTLLAGGKAEFKAQRSAGAGGHVEPFGGKRAGGRTSVAAAADDQNAITVESMRASDGWRVRRLWKAASVDVEDVGKVPWREQTGTVHISPEGVEYIECRTPSEKCDLRVRSRVNDGYLRFRKFESSPTAKHVTRHEKEIERGTQALERTRTRKRAAKHARTARRK